MIGNFLLNMFIICYFGLVISSMVILTSTWCRNYKTNKKRTNLRIIK